MSTPTRSDRPGAWAIIAALPRELAPLARDLRAKRVLDRDGILVQTAALVAVPSPVLLITAGMGAARAALAVEAALSQGPVSALVNVGLAGACDPQIPVGASFLAGLVIDSRTGERFATDPHLSGDASRILVTAPAIAGPAEKRRLFQTYGATAVDMEAAAVARLARAHNLPFAAVKAISDEQAVDLTYLSSFAGARGEFRTARFAAHTAVRPVRWRAALELARGSKPALLALTAAIQQLLAGGLGSS